MAILKKSLGIWILALAIFALAVPVGAVEVRLKDIGRIIEARDNQLLGYGLVVGLRNTGDSKNMLFTNKALTNLLTQMGIPPEKNSYSSRNVASVIVTADLPAFLKTGQRLNVVVSAVGDSTSLSGGTLLRTELKGTDQRTYAVAQGNVIVGGVSGKSSKTVVYENETTVGRIPEGAIIENSVPVSVFDYQNVTLVLDNPNFINASRVAAAITKAGFSGARALDANTIKIPMDQDSNTPLVDLIAKVENVRVEPDTSARVVVNSRTGTVVIGEQVRLFPVAVTQGNISVKIEGNDDGARGAMSDFSGKDSVRIDQRPNKMVVLKSQATLESLVNALNQIGATPKDLISVIQALKEANALVGDVQVL